MRRRGLLRRLGAGIATGPLFSRRASAQADGRQEWVFETGAVVSSPTVADGTVYVGSAVESNAGHLYAVDAASGEEEWEFETDFAVYSATVVNGTVYAVTSDNLYAVGASSGEEKWAIKAGAGATTVTDGTVYFTLDDNLYAVDATSGEQEWRFETEDWVDSSPTVVDGTVYFGSADENLYAVDAASGTEEWAFEAENWIRSSPTMVDGTVYVGSDDWNLYAVDAASGTEEWALETGDSILSSPTVVDGTVYVGSGDYNLYAVGASSGEEEWAFETGDSVHSSPTVVDGTVFVGSRDNNLYAVDAGNGTEKWAFETGDFVISSPTVVDGTVYVGSGDGNLYAVAAGPIQTPTSTPSPSPPPESPTQTPTPSPSPPPENPTRTSTPTPEATTGDEGAFLSSVTALPEEAVGGGVLAAVGGLAYIIFGRNGGGDTTDVSHSDLPEGDQETASERAEPPESVGHRSEAAPRGVTEQSPRTTADFSRKESAPGPPETISSPSSRSLSYAEIKKGDQVGTGGNADVYEAWLPNGDRIALKEPRMNGTVDISEIEKVVEKSEMWTKLDNHDHIVGVVDYGDEPVPWLALEYMDAGDMSAVLATELSFRSRVWIAVSICRAVRHAHRRGVAHLDLKPANVLFRSAGESWPVPKVSDWGLAKTLLDHSQSIEGFSPNYAAPEQFAAEEYGPPDDITDIYQVGAVCYKLFTTEPPFSGSQAEVMRSVLDNQPTPPSSIAEVPTELDDVLLSALAKEKTDRYESIIELRDALADLSDYR